MKLSDLLALILSALALLVSLAAAIRQLQLARHANSLPVLTDMFREHRAERLTKARTFISDQLQHYDLTSGLKGLAEDERWLVQDLLWYYDNLGALVAHQVVDLGPVAGYLGGSIIDMWKRVEPLVDAERHRENRADPLRWQAYFENLYLLVSKKGPSAGRTRLRRWKVSNLKGNPAISNTRSI